MSIDPNQTARDHRRAPRGATGHHGGPGDDPITVEHMDEQSLSDLLGSLIDDFSQLVRQEVELAKTELRREMSRAGRASAMLAVGAVAAFVAILLVSWAAAWGLAELMPAGLAFLIVGVVVGAVAAATIAIGRKRLEQVDLLPRATMASVRRDQHAITERSPR